MVSRPLVVQPRLRCRVRLHDDEPQQSRLDQSVLNRLPVRRALGRWARRWRRATTQCKLDCLARRPVRLRDQSRATRPCRSSPYRATASLASKNTYPLGGTVPTALAIDPQGKFLYVAFSYQPGFSTAKPGPGGVSIFPVNADNSLGAASTQVVGNNPVGIIGQLLQPLRLRARPGALAQRNHPGLLRRTPPPAH
jgi:hypothetical protein